MPSKKGHASKEEAIDELYGTIKAKFEEDGVLREIRCMLQAKMIAMMTGNTDDDKQKTTLLGRPIPDLWKFSTDAGDSSGGAVAGGDDIRKDKRLLIMHELIMEYLHWHGFHYTAEMFSQESGTQNVRPSREYLEKAIGISPSFEYKSLPILLELVVDLVKKVGN